MKHRYTKIKRSVMFHVKHSIKYHMQEKYYEKIIKSGRYEADKMLSDLEAAYKRKLMTLTEKEYLEGLVQADLENRVEEQVKQLGK